MKYKNAFEFRQALENKIKDKSKKENIEIDRLRRDVAFDRFLVRIFKMHTPPWALKGGYAMQLRTDNARTTKDVDIALKEARLFSENTEERRGAIRAELAKQAAIDLGDYFSFIITEPSNKDLSGPPEGGFRFHIEVKLADRSFQKFILDIGSGDFWSEALEELESSDILKFAGFEPQKLLAIPKEQQFAEKLHAYTLPRPEDRPNSRVKDLIDMNLLIEQGMDQQRLYQSLNTTFQKRNTHELNLKLSPPPSSWSDSYTSMAIECDVNKDLNQGFIYVAEYVNKIQTT